MVNNLLIVSFLFLPRMGTDFVFRTTNLTNFTNYALAPLVLASGMYAFGAADQLRAFAMQPILRKSAVSACPKNAPREKTV